MRSFHGTADYSWRRTSGADAQGECQDDDRRKRGRFANEAQSELQIGEHGFKKRETMGITAFFFNGFAASEFEQRLEACFAGWEARGDFFLNDGIEMNAEFVIQILFQGGFSEEKRMRFMARLLFGGLHDQRDRFRQTLPVRFFFCELPTAFGGEFVELCLAAVVRFTPGRIQPAAALQSMQRRI
jgi:hypothetical protein